MSALFELFMSAADMSFMLPSAFMSVIDTFSVVLVVSLLQAARLRAAAATIATAAVFLMTFRMSDSLEIRFGPGFVDHYPNQPGPYHKAARPQGRLQLR